MFLYVVERTSYHIDAINSFCSGPMVSTPTGRGHVVVVVGAGQ